MLITDLSASKNYFRIAYLLHLSRVSTIGMYFRRKDYSIQFVQLMLVRSTKTILNVCIFELSYRIFCNPTAKKILDFPSDLIHEIHDSKAILRTFTFLNNKTLAVTKYVFLCLGDSVFLCTQTCSMLCG